VDVSACMLIVGAIIGAFAGLFVFDNEHAQPQRTIENNHGTVQASHSSPAAPQVHSGHECDDGTYIYQMCMEMVMCPEGTLSAVKNGCTACVDPISCCSDGDSDCEAAFQAQSKGH